MPKREWFQGFFDDAYVQILKAQRSATTTKSETDFLVRVMGLPRGASVLDMPCGYGRHSAEFARRGFHVLGIDHRARDFMSRLPALKWSRLDSRTYILEKQAFDRRSGVMDSEWILLRQGKRPSHRAFRVQFWTLAQWRGLLRRVGIRLVSARGGFDDAPAASTSRRLLLVARRA